MKKNSLQQQMQAVLAQLPPDGLEELARFLEFLSFKYHLQLSPAPSANTATSENLEDSLTAQFQGFVQSPLNVAELNEAYEQYLTNEDE
jgi:hypothetical protein